MSTRYPLLNDLVNLMNGKLSTNGWDVFCSYNVSQINAFLQSQYDADKLAKKVSLGPQIIPNPMGDDFPSFTRTYDIHFDSPKLSFISGRSGYATLMMPIGEGSSYTTQMQGNDGYSKITQLPGGKYSVVAVVPLAAINGDTGQIIEHDNIIEFSDGKEHDNHVIIHFKSEKGTSWDIVSTADFPKKDKDLQRDDLITNFIPYAKTYFMTEVKEVDYALTTVNNSLSSTSASVLTPKSFVFASTGDGEDGVLSLYIQTKESGNPPGSHNPSFQPGDQATVPIPNGYTASIILSNSLVTKSMFLPQMKNSGFDVTLVGSTDHKGFIAELRKDASILVNQGGQSSLLFSSHYDGLDISLKDNPIRYVIQGNTATLEFEGKTTSGWSASDAVSYRTRTYGKVDITIKLNKYAPLTFNEAADDINLAVNVNSSDFTVETKARECDWWDLNCSNSIPVVYQYLKDALITPSIELKLSGLNFFNTTNLLAPGQHIIKFDSHVGVYAPFDFLLVGNVVKKGLLE